MCCLPYGSGSGGDRAGKESGEGSSSSLHERLVAEYYFQFPAVKLSPIRQIHDALSVVGEMLDVHLLAKEETQEEGYN